MIPAEDRIKNLALFRIVPHAFRPFPFDCKGRLVDDRSRCIICRHGERHVAHDTDLRGGEPEPTAAPESPAPKKKRDERPIAACIAVAIALAYIGFMLWYPHIVTYLWGFGA